jgi:hypothetical protein
MRRVADIISHNPPSIFPPYAGHAHAVEVPPGARTLFISGPNGYESDGTSMPPDFAGQARHVLSSARSWSSVGTWIGFSVIVGGFISAIGERSIPLQQRASGRTVEGRSSGCGQSSLTTPRGACR